jgi:hypothetical protein
MKHLIATAGVVTALAFAMPAFAQDSAPGTAVQTGAAASNAAPSSTTSDATTNSNATPSNKTVARNALPPDPMMSRLNSGKKDSATTGSSNVGDMSGLAAQTNGQ